MCQISRLLFRKSPQECQNVTIEFCFIMRIFYELRCTMIIEIVWTFYLKSVPAKFQKYLKHISWVTSGISSSKQSCNPHHPSQSISCNHRHHLLQPSWQRIFSTSNNHKTRVDSDINSDYKASSFDKLYIRRRKWDTARFVRAHQRKYWNALTVGAAMLTMVAAATIVWFPPMIIYQHIIAAILYIYQYKINLYIYEDRTTHVLWYCYVITCSRTELLWYH